MARNKVGVEKLSVGSEEDNLKDQEGKNHPDTVAICWKGEEIKDPNNSGKSTTFRCQKLCNFIASIFSVTSNLTLEEAEAEYKERKLKREEELKEIVEEKVYKTPWVFSICGLLGSILGLTVVTVGFSLWKRENIYTNPEAWYSQHALLKSSKLLTNIPGGLASYVAEPSGSPPGLALC